MGALLRPVMVLVRQKKERAARFECDGRRTTRMKSTEETQRATTGGSLPKALEQKAREERAAALRACEADKRFCGPCAMRVSMCGWAQCEEQECPRDWRFLEKKEGAA